MNQYEIGGGGGQTCMLVHVCVVTDQLKHVQAG